jgi:hypothetical protein
MFILEKHYVTLRFSRINITIKTFFLFPDICRNVPLFKMDGGAVIRIHD